MNDKQFALFEKIISEYRTPAYVFDEGELAARTEQIRDRLPADTALCFAMKANPFLAGKMSELTDRLEVCSPGEYEICIREQIAPEKIVVSGVNKTATSMERIFSYSQGKGIYTIESPLHYQILKECADRVNCRIKVLLRLSNGNQFGMDEDVLLHLLSEIQKDNRMDVIGIHYYGGTQKTSKKMIHELETLSLFGKRLQTEYGLHDLELEYGPGLPVTYFENEKETESEDALQPLNDLCEKLHELSAYSHISIELGRYLAASCGYYLTTVMDQKHTNGMGYLIVDGGIHQINYYGQMLGMKKPYLSSLKGKCSSDLSDSALSAGRKEEEDTWTICGSLCTANDILVRKARIGSVKIGDVLVLNDVVRIPSQRGWRCS